MEKDKEVSFRDLFVPFTTRKTIIFIILAGFILYFFGLFNGFVGDDNTQILGNPAISSFWNLPSFFFENRLQIGGISKLGGLYYKPLLDASYLLIYSLFGPVSFPFHLFQTVIFISNAILVFLFLKTFFPKQISFILSFLFLIHPINSEVVLYIADTQDVLFFFFGMIALLIVTKYHSHKALIASGIFLLLSLFSKETGILFTFACLLYVFIFKRRIVYKYFGYALASLSIYALFRIHAVGIFTNVMTNAPVGRLTFWVRVINIPSIFLFYIKTFFLPTSLSGSWQWAYKNINFANFFVPIFLDLLFIFVLGIVGFFIYKRGQKKNLVIYTFFAVWLGVGLFFHMQIFPLDQTAAERWFYFPIVGLIGMIGVLASIIKVKSKWIFSIVVILFLLLFVRTFARSLDFRDDLTLALHDNSVSATYNSEYIISHTYYMMGRLKEAKIHAERSVELFPYITNYTNLGAIDSRLGDYEGAKSAYLSALKYGDDKLPYENLSSLSLVYGNPSKNIDFIKKSLKKYPEDAVLWFNLAILEYKYANKSEALMDIKKAKSHVGNSNIGFVEYIILNNKSLDLKVKDGGVTFYTY
ncbi:MAG TPA: glycosyltransferase family 39 protein [Patescibacteria group bacterium]